MSVQRGSFDIIGRAWETSKIYSGSNTVKRYDAVVDSGSLKTLGEFIRDPKALIETKGIDFDSKSDERLAKYNVVRIIPTKKLDEINNPLEIYLITDEHGHDLGTYEITEYGPKFKLSKRIQEYNEKMKKENGFSEEEQSILREEYDVKNLETLVGKLSKDEELLIESKEKAEEVIKKKQPQNQEEELELDNKPKSTTKEENELATQQRAISKVPMDMRDEVYNFIQAKGIKIQDILVVDSAKNVADRIDNRKNQINPKGGPVVIVKTLHGGVDSLGNDYYTIQDGRTASQEEANDMILGNIMEDHKDEAHIRDLDSNDNESTLSNEKSKEYLEQNAKKKLEVQEIIEKAQQDIKAENEQYQKDLMAFISDNEADKNVMAKRSSEHKDKINGIISKRDNALDEILDRESEYRIEKPKEVIPDIPEPDPLTEGQDVEEADGYVKDRWSSADPYNSN